MYGGQQMCFVETFGISELVFLLLSRSKSMMVCIGDLMNSNPFTQSTVVTCSLAVFFCVMANNSKVEIKM